MDLWDEIILSHMPPKVKTEFPSSYCQSFNVTPRKWGTDFWMWEGAIFIFIIEDRRKPLQQTLNYLCLSVSVPTLSASAYHSDYTNTHTLTKIKWERKGQMTRLNSLATPLSLLRFGADHPVTLPHRQRDRQMKSRNKRVKKQPTIQFLLVNVPLYF